MNPYPATHKAPRTKVFRWAASGLGPSAAPLQLTGLQTTSNNDRRSDHGCSTSLVVGHFRWDTPPLLGIRCDFQSRMAAKLQLEMAVLQFRLRKLG